MNDSMIGYAGVDWAMDGHAVCVVDEHGSVVVEFDVDHTADGLREMCRRIQGAERAAGGDRATRRAGGRRAAGSGPGGGGRVVAVG